MAESATITCRICLGKIKQEHELMLNPKLEFPSQEVVSITENSVACTKCKVEINETHTLDTQPHLIKKEIKEELVEDEGRSLCIDECTLYCYQCNYGSNDKQILTDHIFTHRLKCNQCNYTSPDTSMFMTHQQIHFRNYAWIKTEEHVSTHTESPRQVPQVSNELLECGNNKIHMKAYAQMTMLESIKKPFKCSLCNYQNKDSKLYKIHKLKHYGEHSFCCDKCDYKTYFKPYLMSHKLVHSDETPFKCNFCDFSSKRLGNLKIHKIIHSGDRPYKCNLCDFTTKRSSNLKVHLNKHSDQRNFCCDQCDHKTNTKDKLT